MNSGIKISVCNCGNIVSIDVISISIVSIVVVISAVVDEMVLLLLSR